MLKKYLPFIFLIAAALLLWYIKSNQRGPTGVKPAIEQTDSKITVPAIITEDSGQKEIEARPPARAGTDGDDSVVRGFNRHASQLIFSKHAKCRMDCRNIDESEIKDILVNGKINYKKIQSDKRGKTYPVEGYTKDKQHVRIVFAPKNDALVVVTVIDLDKAWSCDCK